MEMEMNQDQEITLDGIEKMSSHLILNLVDKSILLLESGSLNPGTTARFNNTLEICFAVLESRGALIQ